MSPQPRQSPDPLYGQDYGLQPTGIGYDPLSDPYSNESLGLLPPQLEPVPQDAGFDPGGRWSSALESLGTGYAPGPAPRGFLQSFASSAVGGLAKKGQRIAKKRAEYEQAAAEAKAATTKRNLAATDRYQQSRQEALMKIAGEGRAAARKTAEDVRVVTAEDLTRFPALSQIPVGTPIPKDAYEKATNAALKIPETPAEKRAGAAADRAASAADRATLAQERANRMSLVQSEGQLVNEYRQDPAIKGYQNIRSNLQTAREAAKQNNGIGDKAIVFAFMRSLEPENPNAVREGEAQSAQDAVGLLQSYQTTLKRFLKGDRFTPDGRKKVLAMIESNLRSRRETFDEANAQYADRARRWQVPPEGFIRSFPQDTVGTTQSRTDVSGASGETAAGINLHSLVRP